MKRFYNNTLMSGAFSKALRVLALLCVLLGFSSSAWAGFWLKSANIAINGTNDADWVGELASSGQSDIALGTVNNAPVIKGAWIRTGKNNNNGNACGAVLYYKIDDGEEKSVSLNYNSEYTENNGNDIIQLWMNKDFTSETATSEGDHTIEFWFKATGHESNTGNCDQSLWYSNNSNNYKITYSIVGGGGDTPGGGTGTEFSFVLDTKTNNFGGWIANGEVYAIFRENEGGKTGETRQVLLEICESDNRLAYYNGTTTFTRTDGTTWTPKEVYVYSDDKNDAIATWDGTKNCMVITNWGKMSNSSGGCTMTTFTGDCDGTSGGGGGGGGFSGGGGGGGGFGAR